MNKVNNKFVNVLQNFSYALSSNIISLLISTLVILVIPKVIGVEEYGYWQLYLFYVSYVGFFHLGWNDGIYLKYGGENYNELNKKNFFSQFWMLFFFQLSLSILLLIASNFFVENSNEVFIIYMVALNLILVNTKNMLLLILQTTNRMKEYSFCTILDRLIYVIFIVLLIILGLKEYQYMVFADLFGKLISFGYTVYICKDIVLKKLSNFYFNLREIFENIKIGINLMFANIASNLILGIVKFGIQKVWSVVVFGKISLTLSISNLMMVFVNALSLAIFPILRRTSSDKLPGMYPIIRSLLMVPLLGMLVVYYPLKELLSLWLPQYSSSLEYMALIFPMLLYEAKVSLLTNTYLKTLRKEKIILKVNLITVILSLITTIICTFFLKSLIMSMLSIVFLLAFRSILAEIELSKLIKINMIKDIILELLLSMIFILIGWFINSWVGIFLYLCFYVFYILVKKKDLNKTFDLLKKLLNKKNYY